MRKKNLFVMAVATAMALCSCQKSQTLSSNGKEPAMSGQTVDLIVSLSQHIMPLFLRSGT